MKLRGVLAVAAALMLAAPAAAGGGEDPRLADAESWAFAIGGGQLAGDRETVGDRLGPFDLVVVDGELAPTAEVAELHERGATVLAYLSVGTIEKWRGWFDRVKRFASSRGRHGGTSGSPTSPNPACAGSSPGESPRA